MTHLGKYQQRKGRRNLVGHNAGRAAAVKHFFLKRARKQTMGPSNSSPFQLGSRDNESSTTTSAAPAAGSNPNSLHQQGSGSGRLQIGPATAAVIRKVVLEHLGSSSSSLSYSGRKCSTVIDMAVALGQSSACKTSYAAAQQHAALGEEGRQPAPTVAAAKAATTTATTGGIGFFTNFLAGLAGRQEKQSMKRLYEWVLAFERLEKLPSSRDIVVSSWDEAKRVLEDNNVLAFFPPTSDDDDDDDDTGAAAAAVVPTIGDALVAAEAAHSVTTTRDRHARRLDADMGLIGEHDDNVVGASSTSKWRQIASVHVPSKLMADRDRANDTAAAAAGGHGDDDDDEESILLAALLREQSIDKADLYFDARIQSAKEYDQALREKSDATRKLEERRKAAEAKKRASALLRTLNDDEKDVVHRAMFGRGGSSNDIVAQCGTDTVQRSSMHTLRPGTWLNDEIIHYFYLMLANRDAELCTKDPSRNRSHFFKSFFITKLLNEGNANPAIDGTYEYRNVKRWSKNVPGKDIFGLNKVVFPVNMGGMHWVCAVIFVKEKKIEIYDSMGAPGHRYLQALFQYLKDEHQDKKKAPLPDADQWQLIPTQDTTPRQRNGYDCGVFTCMFADFVAKDCPLVFSQEHINQCRERIALSILNGKAIM